VALLLPEYLQNKTYAANRLRAMLMDTAIQEGVSGPTDMNVAQRGAGANMSVDVAAGAGWVQGDNTLRQGLYHAYNDATVNLSIGNNATGNPRLDQIILRVFDSIDGGGASDQATVSVLAGTATGGATLDNRSGAAALPGGAIRLADVLVANGAASITNAVIRDRRPRAFGQSFRFQGNAAGNHTTTSTTGATMHSGAYDGRMEKGSRSIIVATMNFVSLNVGGSVCFVTFLINGAAVKQAVVQNTAGTQNTCHLQWVSDMTNGTSLSPGQVPWTWQFATSNGANAATIINNNAALAPQVEVREIVLPV
jgi:hypothetical protein